MTARERLVALLSRHEGYRSHVYDDGTGQPIAPGSHVVGHPTVGYGHCLDTRGLTKPQAERLRDDVLDELEHELSLKLPIYARQVDPRRMALLELAYQCGVDGVLGFRKMLAHLEWREYGEARAELLDSAWARQTGAARVEAVAQMLGDGTWPEA